MKTQPLTLYLPDTRDVTISPFGKGNGKIGENVFTYSRVAGRVGGTCPGSTDECEAICYAKRIGGPLRSLYEENSFFTDAPRIPDECRLLRLHISGDFDTVGYIRSWVTRLEMRPDVTCWAYTRSWRVPALLPALEELRALPNVQLFASMDTSTTELPPDGWRRAWIDGDQRIERWARLSLWHKSQHHDISDDATPSYVCPEQTGRKRDCESCRYCFDGHKNDVTFLRH